jgi:L-iditol 2-dehydrogenase
MSTSELPTHTAIVLHGPKDMRIEQRTLFPPRQGECQVRVVSTGLCGSDRASALRHRFPDLVN